ncbi:MAG: bacteriorhodopsin [Nanoarchaeota archaeon]|nr:bacteriorhodopsin [Nanoarchaeota archaeon]
MFERTIFIIGLFLFLAASTLFPALKKKKDEFTSINMMVSFVTMISYAVLIAGIGAIISPMGNLIYPTRWLFYIISCSLLMYEVGIILKKSKIEILEMIFFNAAVMLTGYFASITLGSAKLVFFSISTAAYLANLLLIHDKTAKENSFMKSVKWYVTIMWSLFPITWMLGPTGYELLNTSTAAVIYLLLDIATKTVFGYYTVKKEM